MCKEIRVVMTYSIQTASAIVARFDNDLATIANNLDNWAAELHNMQVVTPASVLQEEEQVIAAVPAALATVGTLKQAMDTLTYKISCVANNMYAQERQTT
jgi:hypothetical protein